MIRNYVRPSILGLSLTIGVLIFTAAFGSTNQRTLNRKCRQVAVQLDTKQTTQEQIVRAVKDQLNVCGVSATEAEVQTAARNSLNLISKSKDPEKGVIYVNTKKFTICASWGKDKDFCKSH